MKRLFFAVVVAVGFFFFVRSAVASEVCCYKDGAGLYVYQIGKEMKKAYSSNEGRMVAGKTSRINHPLVNDLLAIFAVTFVSVGEESVMLVEDESIDKITVRRQVAAVLERYYPIGKITIREAPHP